MSTIRYELGSDQILTLTIDMPGQSANTMNAAFRDALSETATKVKDDLDNIRGIIIASAKKTFLPAATLKSCTRSPGKMRKPLRIWSTA